MKYYTRHWRFILTLIGGAGLCMTLSACLSDKEIDLKSIFGTPEDLSEVGENLDILYSEDGKVQLRIQGKKMVRSNYQGQAKDVFPEGVFVTFFDHTGREISWLTAKYGTRFPAERKIVLRDSVFFFNSDREEMRTSELIWYENDGTMESSKFVEIRREGEIIRGFGLSAKENLRRIELNAVTGKMKAEDFTDIQ